MCGIAGFISRDQADEAGLKARASRMAEALIRRGPDDSGVWVDAKAGLGLGFRRLAIIDLSPEGHQPMLSACGRYVMVFNGEVYNFLELRKELEAKGHRFRGRSDTEVMLAAFSEWSVTAAVPKFVGMFAFALWDRQERALHLVRDRLGIKPLCYGWIGKAFVFGSELKALRAHPDFAPEVDRGALALYLRYGYIPAPHSIYRGIHKLVPGSILTLKNECSQGQQESTPAPYWSMAEVTAQGSSGPLLIDEREAVARLEDALKESVRLRMIADVPVGAFLSGGIDSSTVVAVMQAHSSRPVKTFTIGFHEDGYNEATHAKAVADHLGTDHTELYVTSDEARAVIPKLATVFDEPFSDSSQIPTFLVSELARRYVTVSLSGDGGDELFGGYPRYFMALKMWSSVGLLHLSSRRIMARLITLWKPSQYDRAIGWLRPRPNGKGRAISIGDRIHKGAELLTVESSDALYQRLVSIWTKPEEIVKGSSEPDTPWSDPRRLAATACFEERMMLRDLLSYLPDDILTKVDRASMGVSLEARVPLLDHRLVEFAARVPSSMKIRGRRGKWLLRQLLYKYVPKKLVERPKMGFGVPIGAWLRSPLRDWAEDSLSERRLKREGYLHPEQVRQRWLEHLSGHRNWQYHLWDILMFQGWLERWG
jgi:asparagine synthase (glutamine-hydrolysing)